jgi:two-component system chemotaxis response regulator CheY
LSGGMTTVMVVDDEPDVRCLTRLLLEGAGYDVTEASSGEEALAQFQSSTVDLVMLDLRMHGISGWEVLSEMAARGWLDHTQVIVFSAQIEPEGYRRAVEQGARGFLTKPFTPDELLTAVAQTVG